MNENENIAPSVPYWVYVGTRVMEMPGYRSQRCGTVVDFGTCNHSRHRYPIVKWDDGRMSFTASDLIDVQRLEEEEQLSLVLFY